MTLHDYILAENKMSKRFLMSLPESAYIVSGVGSKIKGKIVPEIAEHVLPIEKRELQWKKIKEAWCNNRAFNVFKNKQDWERYKKESGLPFL